MKLLYIEELDIEVQLMDNRVFIYSSNGSSDIIYIDDIENKSDAEELIIRELEIIGSSSFNSASLIG
jgi:hypothetical protein